MQNQHKPVLIFAQSGRFLAQSATQAGYRVWVADCFGDQETLSVAERNQVLPPFSTLLSNDILGELIKLAQGEECILICGSGIESTFSFLENLPDNIQLIGNSFNTIKSIKTPQSFFNTLNKLKLPFPDTVFASPKNREDWLIKSASGLGGQHIQYLNKSLVTSNHYFQRYISGSSGSALFLANGKQTQLLSINQQTLTTNKHYPFQLGSIQTPWLISSPHQKELRAAIAKITLEIGLRGLNSLDFIISEKNELLLLEVNPRVSASAELLTNTADLFQHHINGCQGQLPSVDLPQAEESASLYYIYAGQDVIIPSKMIWPMECHDQPTAESLILKGEPICTSLIRLEATQAVKSFQIIEQQISRQLLESS